MIYELRFYEILPGRMRDAHARFSHHVPKLFDRHGIRNIGCWTAVTGSRVPLFVYLIAYRDLNERERAWSSFYADDEWIKVRAHTNAGEEMFSRFTVLFLRLSSAWLPSETNVCEGIGGVHELLLQEVAIGQKPATEKFISETYIPAVQDAGGTIILIAEVICGPHLPRYAMIVAWPNAQAHFKGRSMIETDQHIIEALQRQRASTGVRLFDRANMFLLEPAPYKLPSASL